MFFRRKQFRLKTALLATSARSLSRAGRDCGGSGSVGKRGRCGRAERDPARELRLVLHRPVELATPLYVMKVKGVPLFVRQLLPTATLIAGSRGKVAK